MPVLCYMGAAGWLIWPGRDLDIVRSTFAVFKLCVKMYVFYDIYCLRYRIGSLDACPVLYGSSRDGFSVLPACGLGEATTWSGLHMLYLNCV